MCRITPQSLCRALVVTAGCLAALAAVQPATSAQEKTTLRRVEIVGLQRLSSDQVIATSGLRVGDLIDAPSIDAAAARLMNSGWFKSVNYRVHIDDADTTVIFDVAEKTASTNPAASDTFGTISWSGNRALTNQELTNAFGLRAGDAVTRPKIDQSLEAVRRAYARQGYINAQITESSTRDATPRRVNYQFMVTEGRQYRMGTLTIMGLTPADTRSLKSKWTLTSGAVYDDSYSDQYRTSVLRPFVASLAQRTGARSKYEISTKPDIQKQTVDVIITFR
ncbi:MAG TPA: POTRA domain-containing protein [Pyrinomonadaceae bacterium]|nr:POTRA domain-containing protein [Pyrinomonadaceae bacterium]